MSITHNETLPDGRTMSVIITGEGVIIDVFEGDFGDPIAAMGKTFEEWADLAVTLERETVRGSTQHVPVLMTEDDEDATQKEYRVLWAIDLSATSMADAARQALGIQRDPESTATAFVVTDDFHSRQIDVVDS